MAKLSNTTIYGDISITGDVGVDGAITDTLNLATGNEVALSLNYITNKATSGNDTGLVINHTDTLSPGTSLLLDGQLAGVSKFSVDNAGNVIAVGTLTVTGTTTLTTDLTVANGGTGASTFTDGGVLIGNVAGAVQVTTAGLLGEVLTSNGAGVDPTFQAGGGGGGATVSDDTTTDADWYPTFTDITTGSQVDAYVSSTQLTFNPSTGSLSSVDFITTSDEKFKENIKPIKNALDTVNRLNGKEFDWKSTGDRAYGVIAQDIVKVLPDLVTTNTEGTMQVHYLGIIGHLIEAVKELTDEVNKLKDGG